ncbi:MAG: glutathione-disulfide reductase [Alphaproteobacteria bacterium]|nr:glutathione-disulfide reductase [Alphaproteobacteria bacterium]
MADYDYDLFTIGAGSGGVRAARLAAGLGKRSGVVEEWTVGGTCVHRGCIPKKLYVYAAHFAEDFEDAAAYGWTVEGKRFDWPTLVEAKQRELRRLEGIYNRVLDQAGAKLFTGHATLEDAHTISIGANRVTAENIVISTGGTPFVPPIEGAELAITSDEIFDLPEFPARMVINGAGYIALEFACIMHGLGAEVTVVYRRDRVLRGFDEDIRIAVHAEMAEKGIRFRFEAEIEKITEGAGGREVTLTTGEVIAADQVLLATGRVPNTEGIGLEAAGVELGANGAIRVDEYSRTSQPHIFAVGDCTDRLALTPVAIHEAVCLIDTLYGDAPRGPDHESVATAVFTQPPVGTVGLTEAQARATFEQIDIYRARFRPLKHTITGREQYVMMKLVVDRASDRVLGVHMVGMDAPEIVQALAIAVKAGLTKAQFDATMAVHPTTGEEVVLMAAPVG